MLSLSLVAQICPQITLATDSEEVDLASEYDYSLPEQEEEESYVILEEDTSLREEAVKYFWLKDGGHLVAGYSVPVHYLDEDTGEYVEINNEWNAIYAFHFFMSYDKMSIVCGIVCSHIPQSVIRE